MGDDAGNGRSGLLDPAHEPLPRPIGVAAVGLGRERVDGGTASLEVGTHVAGDALAFVEETDEFGDDTTIERLLHPLIRVGVVKPVDLDMVFDVDSHLLPGDEPVGGGGQRGRSAGRSRVSKVSLRDPGSFVKGRVLIRSITRAIARLSSGSEKKV